MRELRLAARFLDKGVRLLLAQSAVPADRQRKVRFYMLHMCCGVTQEMIGALNSCTKQNVSKHIHEIETLRDRDPAFDQMLSAFERDYMEAD